MSDIVDLVLKMNGIHPIGKAVLAELAELSVLAGDDKTPIAETSVKTLSGRTGIKKSRLFAWLESLEAQGFIGKQDYRKTDKPSRIEVFYLDKVAIELAGMCLCEDCAEERLAEAKERRLAQEHIAELSGTCLCDLCEEHRLAQEHTGELAGMCLCNGCAEKMLAEANGGEILNS